MQPASDAGPHRRLPIQAEAAVQAQVRQILADALARYPGTLADDEAALAEAQARLATAAAGSTAQRHAYFETLGLRLRIYERRLLMDRLQSN